jgi:hypothetical protein
MSRQPLRQQLIRTSGVGTERATTRLARASVEHLKWTISEWDAVSADTLAHVNPALRCGKYSGYWWAREGSNLQPDGYEPPALTN